MSSVISHRFATLWELQTIYDLEDCYDMLEVIAVSRRNQETLAARRDEK